MAATVEDVLARHVADGRDAWHITSVLETHGARGSPTVGQLNGQVYQASGGRGGRESSQVWVKSGMVSQCSQSLGPKSLGNVVNLGQSAWGCKWFGPSKFGF